MSDNVSVQTSRQPRRTTYPKIVVRMIAGCYQYREVPESLASEEEMIAHAVELSAELNLRTCLVLAPDKAWYCEPDGSHYVSDKPPSGGTIVPPEVMFVCKDGTVRQGSPRGPVVRRVGRDDKGRQE